MPERDQASALVQLQRLQRITDVTLGHLSVEQLLDELLIRLREVIGADTAAVLLLDKAADELVATAAKGIEEEVEANVRIPVGLGFAGRIAAERRPVFLPVVDHSNVLNPILREKGIVSLLGVPLLVQGEVLGVLHVGTLTRHDFDEEDVELLQLVADRVALALHVRLYERERFVAETLQRSFLPSALPRVPGLKMSTRYLPAGGGTQVGGDWFDAFSLPGGVVAVAVGDVAGNGLHAATLMGRIRNALRAYAFEGLPPAEVAERLDRLVAHFDPGELVTLLFGVLDPGLTSFTFVLAGHVPPVLLTGDGAMLVEPAAGFDPPLGTALTARYQERTVDLAPGMGFLIYTDGLIERRGESLDASLDRLVHAAAELPRPLVPGDSVDAITGMVLEDPRDDIAVLMLVLDGSSATLEVAVPARARELAGIRRAVQRWLIELDVSSRVAYDIITACSEACANVIEHAYPAEVGNILVQGRMTGERIELVVRDTGRWRPPRARGRGRGMMLMNAMMEHVDVRPEKGGTVVRMTRIASEAA